MYIAICICWWLLRIEYFHRKKNSADSDQRNMSSILKEMNLQYYIFSFNQLGFILKVCGNMWCFILDIFEHIPLSTFFFGVFEMITCTPVKKKSFVRCYHTIFLYLLCNSCLITSSTTAGDFFLHSTNNSMRWVTLFVWVMSFWIEKNQHQFWWRHISIHTEHFHILKILKNTQSLEII